MSPITCKIGHLQSSIIEGIEKYYNKYSSDAQQLLRIRGGQYAELRKLLLELLHRRGNYCLRQKLQLEELLMEYYHATNMNIYRPRNQG